MAPKIIFKFPLPMDGMPQYYSPSFHPSTHIAPSVNPLRISSPKGRALEYECIEVATCRSRPCQSPTSEPEIQSNLKNLDKRTTMGHDMARDVGKALILFNGPRHGEHRLRVEVRRGLRPWGDFYTCSDFNERSCRVAFIDRVEVMGANPPEVLKLLLVGDKDRKFWRFCEDLRISCAKKAQSRLRKADFAACEADFETTLVGWPWGTDVADLVADLTAARGVPFEPTLIL